MNIVFALKVWDGFIGSWVYERISFNRSRMHQEKRLIQRSGGLAEVIRMSRQSDTVLAYEMAGNKIEQTQ